MGHADRPWFHHALSLDAESWRVRLAFAGRCDSQPNAHADINTYRDADSYSDGNTNRNRVTWAGDSNAKAAPHAATAAIARNNTNLAVRRGRR